MAKVKTGLDRVSSAWPKRLRGARVGLVCHPASVDSELRHAVDVLRGVKDIKLAALFGPQHGYLGNTQDNMIEWEGGVDEATGLALYSLYGEHREPTDAMLEGLDALVVDLQDVGARYYTFIWTLALCMKAAQRVGLPVVVLDRPNPIDGVTVEGPVLEEGFESFVGLYPLPIRHGMTVGEVGEYLKARYFADVDYHVVKMTGWKRTMYYEQTGLPWVLPSPNMPTVDTAVVYPGQCLLEGTNVSEARGATRPFELFGAPYVDMHRLVKRLERFKLPGVVFRATGFEPTFQKHARTICEGAQMHVTDRKAFKPFLTTTAIFKAMLEQNAGAFAWNAPPYEYEYDILPIDILAGTSDYRERLEKGQSLSVMERWWQKQAAPFDAWRDGALLY